MREGIHGSDEPQRRPVYRPDRLRPECRISAAPGLGMEAATFVSSRGRSEVFWNSGFWSRRGGRRPGPGSLCGHAREHKHQRRAPRIRARIGSAMPSRPWKGSAQSQHKAC